MDFTEEFLEKFWSKVDKTGDCWIWTGIKNKKGYGMIRLNGANCYTHRVSYMICTEKSIEHKMFILHSCDNPRCVNPDHLRQGTHLENMEDMRLKGRQYNRNGDKNFSAKLTWDQVLEFRRLYKECGIGYRRQAKMFNIPVCTMKDVLSGKSWKEGI